LNCSRGERARFEGVSVVVPFYYNERSVREVHRGLSEVLSGPGTEYELIFVNDGSKDSTPEILDELWRNDERVAVLHFSRNFGQRAAWTAGLADARGTVVVTMDGDGQLDARDIPKLLECLSQGHDVVNGWRIERKDPVFRKAGSWLANWSVRSFGKLKIKDFGCSLRAYRGEFLDQLDFGPHRLYDKASALSLTDAMTDIPVRHHPPTRSGWNAISLVRYGVDNLLTFGDQFFLRIGLWAATALLLPIGAVILLLLGIDLAPFSMSLLLFLLAFMTGLTSLVGLAAARAAREARGQKCYWVRRRLARRKPY
jgi:undecaprenyl-phosphate 4-deoxy-4-formamido-L-arabinose transferase